jgi:hypothetical protein
MKAITRAPPAPVNNVRTTTLLEIDPLVFLHEPRHANTRRSIKVWHIMIAVAVVLVFARPWNFCISRAAWQGRRTRAASLA